MECNIDKIIIIQKHIRGYLTRIKRLPLIMYYLQNYLQNIEINFSKTNKDGRVNSINDEEKIVKLLSEKFDERIQTVKSRMWYDILVYDYFYKWIPVNIKITTTKTNDNAGNLTMCLYAYTNTNIDIYNSYTNGDIHKILYNKLRKKLYNKIYKRDYYFLVLNKNNSNDIIVNSLKGLSVLMPNINNLPFQIKWNNNRTFIYKPIGEIIKMFIKCLQKPKTNWKETFMENMRKLTIE